MKKFIFFIAISIFGLSSISQTLLYENPNFDELTKDHKIIAVLPFKTTVKLRPKEMKDMTPESLAKMEKDEGNNIQTSMYSWFLKRQQKGDMTVGVQDILTTNAKLNNQSISIDNLSNYTPSEIAQILEVDAVIMGTFETTKPMSEGASVALGLLVGFAGVTNKAVLNLYIYNAVDGAVLVNYNKSVAGSLGSSTDDLINILMRKASRRITYTK